MIAIAAVVVAFTKFQDSSDKLKQVFGGLRRWFKPLSAVGKLGEVFIAFVQPRISKGPERLQRKPFSGMGDAIKNVYQSGAKLVQMQQELEKAYNCSGQGKRKGKRRT